MEVPTAVLEEPTDAQRTEAAAAEEAAMVAEFDEQHPSTETPENAAEEPAPKADEAAPAPEKPVEAPPEYVPFNITKAQHDALMTLIPLSADLQKSIQMRGKLEEGFGTLGAIQQTIKDLQKGQGGGTPFTLSEADLQELKENGFEELAKMLVAGINRGHARQKGGGPPVDVKAIMNEVREEWQTETAAKARLEECFEHLDDEHEGWRELVGMPNAQGEIPDTEFRRWAKNTMTTAQHERVFKSKSGPYLTKVINQFKKYQENVSKTAAPAGKQPAGKANTERKERLEAAATPRGVPPLSADTTNDADEFEKEANRILKNHRG